jgi:uncharacterized membrane protein
MINVPRIFRGMLGLSILALSFMLTPPEILAQTFTTIDVPGAVFTQPTGINSAGRIVGFYIDGTTFASHGFLLEQGTYTSIDVPGAIATQAEAINSAGRIVGTYVDSSFVSHGFLLE